jgi:CheY-like chemotaxis protein
VLGLSDSWFVEVTSFLVLLVAIPWEKQALLVASALTLWILRPSEKGIRVNVSAIAASWPAYLPTVVSPSRLRPLKASGGKEAFECAKKYRPQLIMTDYAMPEMDGYEFLNLLKHDSATKDIPVLVITASDSTAGREALLLSGAADVLVKPVSAEALGEMIKRTLGLGCEIVRSLAVPLGAQLTMQHA